MEMILIFIALLQSMAVSLGVGASTLAIINFFVAIADGKIDENERRMMGVVYIVLRIAMIIIASAASIIAIAQLVTYGTAFITPFIVSVWTLIIMLFVNATLMTKHIMPSNFGPAIQAGTWYTLGVTMTLLQFGLNTFTYMQFLLCYIAMLALAVAVVNGVMGYLKKKRTPQAQ